MATTHRHVALDVPDSKRIAVSNHTGIRNFEPNEINKAYAYASTLETNSVIRSETDYMCNQCGKHCKAVNEVIAIIYVK